MVAFILTQEAIALDQYSAITANNPRQNQPPGLHQRYESSMFDTRH
ncbi:MAG: hypothetical protein IM566_22015 [Pseudanabaena sp. M152S2SP2A07QC]|nr:hypothetical protein [Pseudanabaena sp. M152S2SP2A07QC]